MANIRKIGNSYKITVSTGYDVRGKQIRRYMTWTPEPKMTESKAKKEAQRQAVLFEVAPYGLQTKGLIFNVTKPFLYALVRICI